MKPLLPFASRTGLSRAVEDTSAGQLQRKQQHNQIAKMLPPSKKCSKCEHLHTNKVSIHSTLAYSRCRCHRLYQYEMKRHKLPDIKKADDVDDGHSTPPVSSQNPEIVLTEYKQAHWKQSKDLNNEIHRPVGSKLPKLVHVELGLKPDPGSAHKQVNSHRKLANESTKSIKRSKISDSKLPTIALEW